MPTLAREPKKRDFILVSPGTHHAICFAVWDLGKQKGDYLGNPTLLHRVKLAFEIVDEVIKEGDFKGKRLCLFKEYTLSLDKKANLRGDLEAWRGRSFTAEELKGFDLDKLIGINCMVAVIHKEKKSGGTRAEISGISKLMASIPAVSPENKTDVPKWIKQIIDTQIHDDVTPTESAEDYADTETGASDESIPF